MDFNNKSSQAETTDDVPESCQGPNRKGGDTAKVITIPTETANYIMFVCACVHATLRHSVPCRDQAPVRPLAVALITLWHGLTPQAAGRPTSLGPSAEHIFQHKINSEYGRNDM